MIDSFHTRNNHRKSFDNTDSYFSMISTIETIEAFLTYSYLTIFQKVVTKRITCTNLSIFQFDPIHLFVQLFTRSQTFLQHL
ncbi:unnamed protein product [Spirodela intermedia]|uniref:Ycf2 N-terminal domain-containing protein n=1 Tax=Spirodela intermedia TaxID=51605 RepID=A0A7I8JPG1_SPIIN|nr:unnamed protein product [Spirodela intermedia]CAA6672059.1 unnamed protein product [Spirodela intermedia]